MEPPKQNFTAEYLDIKRRIERVEKIIPDVIDVFIRSFKDKGRNRGEWPYEIVDDRVNKDPTPQRKNATYSFSTNSMIMFTLAVISGVVRDSPLIPEFYIKYSKNKKLEEVLIKAFKKLINASPKPKKTPFKEDMITYSYTFGFNDPFTFSWFLELIYAIPKNLKSSGIKNIDLDTKQKMLLEESMEKIKTVAKAPHKPFLHWKLERTLSKQPEHVFPLLRVIQLLEILKRRNKDQRFDIDLIFRYFNNCIYRHLSCSAIPDSGFDPAELVFSLEGSFLCKPEAISEILIKRVFRVLIESHKQNPFWKPGRPIVATAQGETLMPVSVEIVNSILRIYSYLESDDLNEIYIPKNIDLLTRYEDWLRSRIVRGISGEKNFIGWQSEYIPNPGIIHMWETSQVLLFLIYYISFLQKYLAHRSVQDTNLSIKVIESKEENEGKKRESKWEKIKEEFEPMKGLDFLSPYKIFHRIGENYIKPRDSYNNSQFIHRDMNYSMLLYGPPGTGKTRLAKKLAEILKFPLIEITPSDFIMGGEAQVEERAKKIFQTLKEQRNVIILFDEIDRMILDRDSNLYKKQSDIFQFMTPGMLNKFQELREKEKSIFIIATNYIENIDKAIKRKGRVDDLFLLLPPDFEKRKDILNKLIVKKYKNKSNSFLNKHESILNDISKKTALFVYNELEILVEESIPRPSKKNIKKCLGNIKKNISQPTITLSNYYNRFKTSIQKEDFPTTQKPLEEFLILLYLKIEKDGDLLGNEDKKNIRKIINNNNIDKVLETIRDEEVRERLRIFFQ